MTRRIRKRTLSISITVLVIVLIVFAGIRGYRYAKQKWCCINLCSMVSCIHVYMNDYNDTYPTPHQWCDLIKDEARETEDTFKCPGAKEGPCSYAMNKNASAYKYGTAPDDLVFIFESKPGWNQVGGSELLTTEYHEGRGCHIMYANLTVAFVKKEDLASLRWE